MAITTIVSEWYSENRWLALMPGSTKRMISVSSGVDADALRGEARVVQGRQPLFLVPYEMQSNAWRNCGRLASSWPARMHGDCFWSASLSATTLIRLARTCLRAIFFL